MPAPVNRWSIWGALLVIYVVWGSTYLAIRLGVATIPPFLMAACRFLVAGTILYLWRRKAGDPAPTKIEWRSAAIVGFLLLTCGNGSLTWAEQRVPSGISALIIGAAPIWMVLVDALRPGGKRPGLVTTVGVLIGFAGITLLIGPGNLFGESLELDTLGALVLLFSALAWALGSIYNREAKLPKAPLMAPAMEMLFGGVSLLALGTLTGEWTRLNLAQVSLKSILGLGYLIFLGSLVGFVAYIWLLRVASTPLVSTYAYVNPLIAILLGNLIAGEQLTSQILFAALVILGSVALINTARMLPVGEPASD